MSEAEAKKNTRGKKMRLSDKATVFVFVAFIAVFALLLLILPKHEGELSPNERRVLASAPNASYQNIVSGKFSKEVDTWLEDHFPGRLFFFSAYSYLNRLTGRNAVEEISIGANDRLFEKPIPANEDTDFSIDYNITKIRSFAEKNGLNSFAYIIPSSGYMLEEDLPKPHFDYHDGELIARFKEGLEPAVELISAEEVLKGYGDVRGLYYRTDHHLTMRGSYVSYCAIAKKLGLEPLSESEFTKTGYPFEGTYYGRSGLFLTPSDTLETWVGPYDSGLKVRIISVDGKGEETETVHTGSLDTAQLAEDVTDKYAAYLYSNHGITVIENPEASEGTLVVVKDSYGNAIVPFLAAHYRTVVMLDLRNLYYGAGYATPSELCERFGAADFVVITGLDTVSTGILNMLR
ncbi:MAG: hypothetical protein IJM20_01045 [Clostridia bacterium]|nr:hypothetical protein [Clostridia bacterium]